MEVHIFESTHDAYDWSQVGEYIDSAGKEREVNDGDVLVVPSEGIIGVLISAWPVAVVKSADGGIGSFHEAGGGSKLAAAYAASFKLARETARSDADVTGNEHWKEA